jgi:hypothetical protein
MPADRLPTDYTLPIYKINLLGVFAHYRQMLLYYRNMINIVDPEKNVRVARHVEDVRNLPWISGGIASTKSLLFEICNYRYRKEGKRFEECFDLSEEDYFGIMNDIHYDSNMYIDIPPSKRGVIQVDWESEKPAEFIGYDHEA